MVTDLLFSRSWIGSVQYALIYLPALVAGRLFDLGYFKIPSSSCKVLLLE
ncbi:hypothetical protein AZE42_05763 [Rhizopogon vesiculosus]|uniref:Uncharacterized protein n=1 Tax=Rhizopogon vesiculosus TaxID=180088 RepID=A0A1J8QP79_9AGAM|nr:hypothetical protein AZE42_05763 [Rhizopogon vesiculosus]